MKAAVFLGKNKGIKVDSDYNIPEIDDDEVLIKVKYCGICGSDLSNYLYQIYNVPIVMGHEYSGKIAKMGDKVQKFSVGDEVTSYSSLEAYQKMTQIGIFQDGAFAEYVKVKASDVFKKPSHVSLKQLCLAEPLSGVIHARNISNIPENKGIIIIGSGIMGLSLLEVLNVTRNPKYILMVDLNGNILKIAKELGATETFHPKKKVKIRRFTKKNGLCKYVFDCAGSASSYLLALELVNPAGTVLLEGIKMGNIPLPVSLIIMNEITVQGSYGASREEFAEALKLLDSGNIHTDKLLSNIYPLSEINTAFQDMANETRTSVKCLIKLD